MRVRADYVRRAVGLIRKITVHIRKAVSFRHRDSKRSMFAEV